MSRSKNFTETAGAAGENCQCRSLALLRFSDDTKDNFASVWRIFTCYSNLLCHPIRVELNWMLYCEFFSITTTTRSSRTFLREFNYKAVLLLKKIIKSHTENANIYIAHTVKKSKDSALRSVKKPTGM